MSPNRYSGNRSASPIRIGLVTDEPIRLAGLASIFDQPARKSQAQLLPVVGSMPDLLLDRSLKYLVVDVHSSTSGFKSLETIRRARHDIKSIVIGPEGNDELVLRAITAGARGYLDQKASPETVRKAIEVVTEGSTWAPRRLVSKLIDRLIGAVDTIPAVDAPQLTDREQQVLELIMKAHSNREIASKLGIEERTVRAHLARLMRKAGVDNRIKLSISAASLLMLPRKTSQAPRDKFRGSSPVN